MAAFGVVVGFFVLAAVLAIYWTIFRKVGPNNRPFANEVIEDQEELELQNRRESRGSIVDNSIKRDRSNTQRLFGLSKDPLIQSSKLE